MGSGNVGMVYARWGHLPDRPFRLLVFMALVSMDEDEPPMFYKGREAMGVALGRLIPPAPAPTDLSERAEQFRKERRADFEAVKNALRQLTKVGVVVCERESGPGQVAVYSLRLKAGMGKVSPVEQGRPGLSTGKVSPVEQGRPGLPPSPIEHQEPKVSTTSTQVGTSPGAAANSESKNLELEYAKASEILSRLPDLGSEYLSRVPDGPLRDQVIAAAALFQQERNAS